MAYADYAFYKNEYFGSIITEDAFAGLSVRASSFLDYYTKGKAQNNADLNELKMACCAVAEKIFVIDSADKRATSKSGALQSESVGSYSVSYQSGADIAQNAQASMVSVARQYLAHTGLLYRGGGCC